MNELKRDGRNRSVCCRQTSSDSNEFGQESGLTVARCWLTSVAVGPSRLCVALSVKDEGRDRELIVLALELQLDLYYSVYYSGSL